MLAPAQKNFSPAREHDHVHALVHARPQDAAVEVLHHLVRVRVRRRVIQRQDRDAVRAS
jgi:REP element-mobilizing transposase RayT